MTKSPEFPLFTPESGYFERAWEKISHLPQGSILFFGVEGTAIISLKGEKFLRDDFVTLFRKVKAKRKDIVVVALTYRSEETGISELNNFEFGNVIYAENIESLLHSTPPHQITSAIIGSLLSLPDISATDELSKEIENGQWKKVLYLMILFNEYLPFAFLVDDGPDGELAEQLGVGVKA